jgi:hypothetical protein
VTNTAGNGPGLLSLRLPDGTGFALSSIFVLEVGSNGLVVATTGG